MAQEARGLIKTAASASQHVTHTPLRAENNSARTLGEIVPSGKTSKGLRGQRRTASAAPAEPCPELFPSRICRPTASWPGPVAAGSSLPRDKTACTCLSCSRSELHSLPDLRPAWTRVPTGPASQTLSLQAVMSQGSWDLRILNDRLPQSARPMTAPHLCPGGIWISRALWEQPASLNLSFALRPTVRSHLLLRLNDTCSMYVPSRSEL